MAAICLLGLVGAPSLAQSPAPGTWTLSGGNVVDTETNNSGQPIRFFYIELPAGVTVTAGGTVNGGGQATCQVGQFGQNPPATNQVECGFPGGWANGTTITFTFPVSDPQRKLSTSPPPTLKKYVSYNGSSYAPVIDVPPAAVTPLEKPPCKCTHLTAWLKNFRVFGDQTTGIEFDVNWQLTCTRGDGNCTGRIKVLAPRSAYWIEQNGKIFPPRQPRIVTVDCKGPCGQATKGKDTIRWLALMQVKDKRGKVHTVPNPRFTPRGRANKWFEIRLGVFCNGPLPQIIKLRVNFDRYGQVDYRRSHLVGPG